MADVTVASALASFALVAGLLTVVPGLDTALVLRAALTQGRSAAFATGIGVSTGSLTWGVASAAGVSALLVASAQAFAALRVAGAGYLLWTGAVLLLRALRPAGPAGADDGTDANTDPNEDARRPADPDRSLVRAWRRGLLTNLLNPKVGVFYLVMIPQFLPAGAPHLLMGLLLAGVHVAEGTAWFAGIILLASAFRRWLAGARARRAIDGVTGTALVGFGVRLVVT